MEHASKPNYKVFYIYVREYTHGYRVVTDYEPGYEIPKKSHTEPIYETRTEKVWVED